MEQSPKQSPAAVEPVADLIEPVAWRRMNKQRTASTGVTDVKSFADQWEKCGEIVEPLVPAASLSQLSTKLANAGRGWSIAMLAAGELRKERDELRAKLAEAIKVIDLAVDLQCELGSHYELRAAAIRARAVKEMK